MLSLQYNVEKGLNQQSSETLKTILCSLFFGGVFKNDFGNKAMGELAK